MRERVSCGVIVPRAREPGIPHHSLQLKNVFLPTSNVVLDSELVGQIHAVLKVLWANEVHGYFDAVGCVEHLVYRQFRLGMLYKPS
jgi:hypothetical protein